MQLNDYVSEKFFTFKSEINYFKDIYDRLKRIKGYTDGYIYLGLQNVLVHVLSEQISLMEKQTGNLDLPYPPHRNQILNNQFECHIVLKI